jgi:hypothetical protein
MNENIQPRYRVLREVQEKTKKRLFDGVVLVRMTITKLKQSVNGKRRSMKQIDREPNYHAMFAPVPSERYLRTA